ncbi:ABC transporter permease [Microbacterium amylolyticum]|uniref:ABC-2 type transport system permease protein n=1 Tax=Microbacterium amylolyticum TaxID=936337 RepID=A0ABS4ZEU6_9MICO|nr:ABC transporter permease [Microbacterium amylolyticum]MBP2435806.1 ABC-2 type transport system permease protein [Microbacterium amylolyticum]
MTTTGYDIPRQKPPGIGAWAQLTLSEIKSVMRDTAGLVVPIGMPSLFLVVQGFSTSEETLPFAGGRSVLEVYVLPLMLVMVVALIGVVNMPSFLATYRKEGLLKRLAATPARPAMVLVAQVMTSVVQTLLGVGIALGISAAMFGLIGPERLLATIGVFLLICAAMYAVGMMVAAFAPTPNASVAIGLVAFFLFGALGGLFGGADALPDQIRIIGEWTPFGAGATALQSAWIGETVPWQTLTALAAATVIGALCAIRFFRWSR